MSSLWTPDGERPVERHRAPSGSDPQAGRELDGEGLEELDAELRAMTEEIVSVPGSAIVANHCVGLFQLAVAHLQCVPPNLDDARLAIDSMAAVVEGVRGRLGPDEGTLIDALAQVRLAFVQVASA